MNNKNKNLEQPLTISIARELIIELFNGQTNVQRQEIIRAVDERHTQQGGKLSTHKGHPVVYALNQLKEKGLANNPNRGQWSIFSKNPDPHYDQDPATVGCGKSSVYLYYYPTYQKYAAVNGREVWECKIGRTGYDERRRVESQAGTALPEDPVIGLTIKTDEPERMEQTIHNILKFRDKQKAEAPGTEWFLTSPSEVKAIYNFIVGNS